MDALRFRAANSVPEDDFTTWLARQAGPPTSSALLTYAKITAAKARNAEILNGTGAAPGGAAGRHPRDAGGTIADLERLAFERPHAFAVITVDVPSEFRNFSEGGAGRSPQMHYPVMTVDELCALGPLVRALAAPDCALLYWTSPPNFENAFKIVGAWAHDPACPGKPVFRFSTRALLWVKTLASLAGRAATPAELDFGDVGVNPKIFARGTGQTTAANAEELWLFRKGAPLRLDTGVDELLFAPRGSHSAKPDEARRRLERLFAGPYLELFGRKPEDQTKDWPPPGWVVWGNQSGATDSAAAKP